MSAGGFLGASPAVPAAAATSPRGWTSSFFGQFLGHVLARPAAENDQSGTSGEPASQLSGFLAPTDATPPPGDGSTDDELRGQRRLPDLRGGFLGGALR